MAVEPHPVFVSPSPDTTLWRYMDLAKYLALLANRGLYFCSADRLGDILEGSYPLPNRDVREQIYRTEDLERLRAKRESLRRETLISCWHANPGESAAMWDIYTERRAGIAIRTTFDRLARSLTDTKRMYHAGMVQYIDFDTAVIDESNHLSPFIHKRLSFSYENEMRVLAFADAKLRRIPPSRWPDTGEYISVDLGILVEAVFVAPSSKSWFRGLVEQVGSTYGVGLKVKQSDLVRAPFI